jgi:hypothetical protein
MAALTAVIITFVIVGLYYLAKIGRRESGLPPGIVVTHHLSFQH